MCWIGLKEWKSKATEPVQMYKVLRVDMVSPFHPYRYRLGYEECVTIEKDPYTQIPSFYDVIEFANGIHGIKKDCRIFVNPMSLEFTMAEAIRLPTLTGFILVEGVIPKGSIYYVNREGAMIAERWIPLKKVKFSELDNYFKRYELSPLV